MASAGSSQRHGSLSVGHVQVQNPREVCTSPPPFISFFSLFVYCMPSWPEGSLSVGHVQVQNPREVRVPLFY